MKKDRIHIAKMKAKALKLKFEFQDNTEKVQVISVPLAKIHMNKNLFQNREGDYSSETVNRIVEAVKNGEFNWEVFDPILLWKSPKNGKLYILSGHSRTEAFRRLAKEDSDFIAIPSKIIEVSEKEAIRIAKESNNLSTKESNTERANYYRMLRKDTTEKEMIASAKKNEGKNWRHIVNLSYLNPHGFLIDSLKSLESGDITSKNNISTISDWVGEARSLHNELTDSHENEIANWLIKEAYGTKPGQFSNKRDFLDRLYAAIEKKTAFGKFKSDQSLNLRNAIAKNPSELEWDKQVSHAKKNLNEAEKAFKEKSEKFYQAVLERRIKKEKANDLLNPYAMAYGNAKSKLNKILSKKLDVRKEGTHQAVLFGFNNRSDLRNRIRQKFQGKFFINKDLGRPILVKSTGIDHAVFKRARLINPEFKLVDEVVVSAFINLDKVLMMASYIGHAGSRKKRERGIRYHYFEYTHKYRGAEIDFEVVVRENKNGDMFYDLIDVK